MSKYVRCDNGPFEGWHLTNIPKCIRPENRGRSTVGLSKTQRTIVLKALGYSSYASYLRSDLWHEIRSRVLTNATCACGCGKRANQVHHKSYTEANLLGETLAGMIAINNDCHYQVEFDGPRKTRLHEANRSVTARQSDSVKNAAPPTSEEIHLYISGKNRKLTLERRLAVKFHLKAASR